MVGDPRTEEGQALIRQASPLFQAERIQRPLLIIQGANDPRVKQAEADQIVIALRDRGHDVSYILANDEGHGFAKPVNRMAMYAEVERFLAEKLAGRFQSEMPEEVANRLEELRVNIHEVTYTPPSAIRVDASLPTLDLQIQAGIEKWQITLELPDGNQVKMDSEIRVTQQGDDWSIAQRIRSPFGEIQDDAVYSHALEPRSRRTFQSPRVLTAEFANDRIVCRIDMDGQIEDTEMEYQGALLCAGPAVTFLISSLPREPGSQWVVNVANLDVGQVHPCRLSVVGLEDTEAGQRLRIDLVNLETPADTTQFWLDPTTNQVVRWQRTLPQMGNSRMIMTRE
jgi:hypothetical protein